MASKKELNEYKEKYGDIPKNYFERFLYVISELNIVEKDRLKIVDGIKKILGMKWDEINFVFYFVPKATPRARLSPRTKTFYVRNASSNYLLFKQFIEEDGHDLGIITTPTKLLVDLYMPIPNNMSRIEKVLAELRLVPAVSTPDWDNAGKTYSDMIQKSLLLDDSLVIDGRVRKFYSFKPRIEVRLEYMREYDTKYNKKKIEGWKRYQELADKIVEKDHICK